MHRSERNLILRVRWTPAKLEQVEKYLDEERKLPPELAQFQDGFEVERVLGKTAWRGSPIIVEQAEKEKILKHMYYDEA